MPPFPKFNVAFGGLVLLRIFVRSKPPPGGATLDLGAGGWMLLVVLVRVGRCGGNVCCCEILSFNSRR